MRRLKKIYVCDNNFLALKLLSLPTKFLTQENNYHKRKFLDFFYTKDVILL